MRNLSRALAVTAILTAVWAIGATAKKHAPVEAAHYETATLAVGCFWGLQETLRQIPGVVKTTAGYTGGTKASPTYEEVAGGKSGHVEAVEVVFDPAKLSYEDLVNDFLVGLKAGAASRSEIFYHDEGQRLSAKRVKINRSGKGKATVMTQILAATKFYPAEEYHQDYYRKSAVEHKCDLEKD
jgi:methionine-S-sulfoxide reductase